MASSVCPTCQSPIDPTRAPVARVRGARVVSYCSVECADAEARAQTAPPADEPAEAPAEVAAPVAQVQDPASAPSAAAEDQASRPDIETPAADDEPRRADLEAAADDDDDAHADDETGADDADRDAAPEPQTYLKDVPSRGSRRNKIIAISAAIMMGGMAVTIINAVSPSAPSDVRAAERARALAEAEGAADLAPNAQRVIEAHAATEGAQVAAAEAKEPDPASPEALRERATETLRTLLASPSDRMQRIAAMALARTGDPEALTKLGQLLEDETAELGKVEIAYALARAGDAPARRLLLRRLENKRRDVRVDAARALVSLGDDGGQNVLDSMLSLRSHRLGAASLLARLGIQRGVAALERELTSDKSSEETRIRAAVSLGRAGRPEVRDQLVALLDDGRYHVGAADALARLGDTAAVPALERQLALPSLRVRAALGLRRMDHPVDLAPLEAALDHGSDPARVSAAEAILILTGPRQLAELD